MHRWHSNLIITKNKFFKKIIHLLGNFGETVGEGSLLLLPVAESLWGFITISPASATGVSGLDEVLGEGILVVYSIVFKFGERVLLRADFVVFGASGLGFEIEEVGFGAEEFGFEGGTFGDGGATLGLTGVDILLAGDFSESKEARLTTGEAFKAGEAFEAGLGERVVFRAVFDGPCGFAKPDAIVGLASLDTGFGDLGLYSISSKEDTGGKVPPVDAFVDEDAFEAIVLGVSAREFGVTGDLGEGFVVGFDDGL